LIGDIANIVGAAMREPESKKPTFQAAFFDLVSGTYNQ
jgi:hypothetical protein